MIQNNNMEKTIVEVKNLYVSFSELQAVRNLSFKVKAGDFICVIGQSGCGKTTILNTIAGFIKSTKGSVLLAGTKIEKPTPKIGFVFQKYVLFPWKTVIENVEFGLKIKDFGERKRKNLARQYIKMVNLNGFENKYPYQLSGGMEQRVGIARALANNPDVILMDEPFASLDAITRMVMQELLLEIYIKTKKTVIFITHNIDEAIFLADRIIVLTKKPAQVRKIFQVNVQRPRDYKTMSSNKEYIKLKENILALVKE